MADLAAQSRVSKDTIRRFEGGDGVLPRTIDSLKAALTRAGVEFIASGKPTEDLELHLPDGTIVRRSRG